MRFRGQRPGAVSRLLWSPPVPGVLLVGDLSYTCRRAVH